MPALSRVPARDGNCSNLALSNDVRRIVICGHFCFSQPREEVTPQSQLSLAFSLLIEGPLLFLVRFLF